MKMIEYSAFIRIFYKKNYSHASSMTLDYFKRFFQTVQIMNHNMRSLITPARIMCLCAACVLTIGAVMSFDHVPTRYVIIPKPEITIFVANALSALLCIFLVFRPDNYRLQVSILFCQAILTTLTGFETLGTFLYAAFIILCFCNGFFKTKLKRKIYTIIVIWILVLAGLCYTIVRNYPDRGVSISILQCAISVFFFGFYFYVYKKLERLLTTLVPATLSDIKSVNLPTQGSQLRLSDYGLSERQTNILLEYLKTKQNYEMLAQKFFVSKSTVKKEMTEIFAKFGVKNLNDLNILLLQYIVKA